MIGCIAMAIMRTTKIAASMLSIAAVKRNALEVWSRCQRFSLSSTIACFATRVNRSRAKKVTMTTAAEEHRRGELEGGARADAIEGQSHRIAAQAEAPAKTAVCTMPERVA
jgi:hypothetical protein